MWLTYLINSTVVNSLRSSTAGQLRKKVDMVTSLATVCMIVVVRNQLLLIILESSII